MASFSYKAKTANGGTVSGRFDAADKNMVVSLLRSKEYYPIEIKEIKGANRDIKLFSRKGVSIKDLAVLCRQFYTMINAGVSVIACLDMLRKQTENAVLVEVLHKVYEDVQKGRALSESLKTHLKVFPLIFISMIEVGEVSGTLDVTMERLAHHFEKENKTRQKIKAAMAYPIILGCIALGMVFFMLAFVVPRFVSIFSSLGANLPTPTRILMNISNTLSNWHIMGVVFGIIALVVYSFKKFKSTEKGKLLVDNAILRIPLVGVNIKKILASRFTRTLSSLLNTGVPLIQALDVLDRVISNQAVTKGLVRVKEDIRRGSNLAGPLEGVGIFPVMVTHMISIGEEAGSLDTIMEKVADFYDDELDASISRLISLLEPILILFVAIVVGAIVISIILPVFEMYKGVGKA